MSRLTFSSNRRRVLDENSVVAKFRGKEDVAAIGKQPGVKKKVLADVANTMNQKFAESQTPVKKGIQLLPNRGQFKVFDKSDRKLDTPALGKHSKLSLKSIKKELNIKETLLLGKDSMKQISEKPIKDIEKLTEFVESIPKEIEIPNKPKSNDEFNFEKDNHEKPEPAIVVHIDDEDEEETVEEFGCNHCLQSEEEDDYEDILPKYLRLTPGQINDSAMCWAPKPTDIEPKPFTIPFLPEPPVYETEDMYELDNILLTI